MVDWWYQVSNNTIGEVGFDFLIFSMSNSFTVDLLLCGLFPCLLNNV